MSLPVLFLHGWAMRGDLFEEVTHRLGPGFDCHAPDLPGHGSRADQPGGLAACVDLACDWITRLDRPLVIGWSMGAGVAWRSIARRGTAGIRGLVTIDMSPRMLPADDWDMGMIASGAEAILATSDKIIPEWPRMSGSIARTMYARTSDPQPSRQTIEEMLLAQDPRHLRPVWDDLVAMDMRDTIADIDVPYLVCTGADSRLYREDVAQWIAAQAPQAQVARFAQSGHSPHLEEPEAFCDAICRFVAAQGWVSHIPEQEGQT
ncbi:MAG: alpha/beta hydrolase [Pseudomonadota bacterium]|nr:alpha/beta hydrolase [Pseudomonadota bacterium]